MSLIEPKSPSRRLRIGAVNYLNTKPLVFGLAERLPQAELVFDLPSRLADDLANDKLDVALVPSIEWVGHPDWSIVSDACIGCRGPVLSVKLMFRVPPEDVQTLALDEGSRTSAVLAQILLQRQCGVTPQLVNLPIEAVPEEFPADVLLVIGDRAICNDDRPFVEVWDLGQRWSEWTDLPFVFAMWIARPGVETTTIANALSAARDEGCRHLKEISQREALAMQLPEKLVLDYLTKNLDFRLDQRQLASLDLFYRHAFELGLIDCLPESICDDCSTETH